MGSSGCRSHLVEGLRAETPGSNPGSFAPRLCGVSTDAPLPRRPIPLLRPSKTTQGEQAVRTATSPLWTAGPGSQTRTAGSAQRVIRGQPPGLVEPGARFPEPPSPAWPSPRFLAGGAFHAPQLPWPGGSPGPVSQVRALKAGPRFRRAPRSVRAGTCPRRRRADAGTPRQPASFAGRKPVLTPHPSKPSTRVATAAGTCPGVGAPRGDQTPWDWPIPATGTGISPRDLRLLRESRLLARLLSNW